MMKFVFLLKKKPNWMVPFLVEHCLSIIGAVISIFALLLKPKDIDSNAEQSYTTDKTDDADLSDEHRGLYTIAVIIALMLSAYSWLVIFTLYKQYKIWQMTAFHGAAMAMQRNVATIENGYDPTYSRNKIGIQ